METRWWPSNRSPHSKMTLLGCLASSEIKFAFCPSNVITLSFTKEAPKLNSHPHKFLFFHFPSQFFLYLTLQATELLILRRFIFYLWKVSFCSFTAWSRKLLLSLQASEWRHHISQGQPLTARSTATTMKSFFMFLRPGVLIFIAVLLALFGEKVGSRQQWK